MKILIVSDTHRSHEYLEQALELEGPVDRLIHLGDAEGCEEEIAKMADCPLNIVAGNNDFFCLYAVGSNRGSCGILAGRIYRDQFPGCRHQL